MLWIGTESGLNRFQAGRFAAFTTSEGLPVDLVNQILEDDAGYLSDQPRPRYLSGAQSRIE